MFPVIQEAPEDEKAFHCKIVCLIQLGKFDEALGALRKNAKLSAGLVFEKAYCEYRLNRSDEALRTIRSVGEPDARTKELLGQVVGDKSQLSYLFSFFNWAEIRQYCTSVTSANLERTRRPSLDLFDLSSR